MTDQARAGIEKLESLTRDARILDPLRAAVESSSQPLAEPEPEITEIDADAPAELAPEPAHAEAAHAEASDLTALVADLEASLGDSFPHAQPPAAHTPVTQLPDTQPL